MIHQDTPIFVAGHLGMVGSALVRQLQGRGYRHLLLRSRSELDLLDTRAVMQFLGDHQPGYIFIAAARVGGILANASRPADFLFENLQIQNNLIQGAHRVGVQRLMFLGSSCVYPRHAPQPIREEALLSGPLESTNEAYAIAKIAGIKLCESFNRQHGRLYGCVMPTNLYGPNDNYDLASSHVLPALIRKAHEARLRGDSELVVWGTGRPRREFLHVDDLAEACVFLMEHPDWDGTLTNLGVGKDLSIHELALLVMDAVGFKGRIAFDTSKPDGTPQKLLDVSKATHLGWRARIPLQQGIRQAYEAAPFFAG
jgi:GDP-L-fucose synthase